MIQLLGVSSRLLGFIQRTAWRIGRLFCEIGEEELVSRIEHNRSTLEAEHASLLEMIEEDRHQRDVLRAMVEQTNAHILICEQEHEETKRRFLELKRDRDELFEYVGKGPDSYLSILKEDAS